MKRKRPLDRTASAWLTDVLPTPDPAVAARLEPLVRERPVAYPLGSGQGSELALRAGLRPMMRELIHVGALEASIARVERAGLVCEVSPLVLGATHDGWLKRAPTPDGSEDRRPLYVGRDRAALRAAIDAELARTDDGTRALGALLGYPRCCVEAFVGVSRERRAQELWAAAWARTEGRPAPRLDVLDLSVFSLVPWYPCTFVCAASVVFADAMAALIERVDAAFLAAVDRAHATHRLVLAPEVQLSLDGRWDGRGVRDITTWLPAARMRDPRAPLPDDEVALTVRALAWLDGAREVRVDGRALVVDGTAHELGLPGPLPLLVPFGA
jgi:hypothetical protein